MILSFIPLLACGQQAGSGAMADTAGGEGELQKVPF
jgi:hypothetical protein